MNKGIPYKQGEPLPLHPGDIVYMMNPAHFYEIEEEKIHGVGVYQDHCHIILDNQVFDIVKDCSEDSIEEVFFLTKEDAQNWKEKHMIFPPFKIYDNAIWVSPDKYIPYDHNACVYVKIQTPEGIKKMDAYYDTGREYPEDRGFWDGTGRHSKRLDNVIAWIDNKHWDPEEND